MIAFAGKEIIHLEEKKIIACSLRTSFSKESTVDEAEISNAISSYFSKGLQDKILNKKSPGVMIDGFMDYDSKNQKGCFYDGDYTYFVGEEVSEFSQEDLDSLGLKEIKIPAGKYVKFTTVSGPMPDIIINAWHSIWKMTEEELGGQRSYLIDFEVFDESSRDPLNAAIDIYIGIK